MSEVVANALRDVNLAVTSARGDVRLLMRALVISRVNSFISPICTCGCSPLMFCHAVFARCLTVKRKAKRSIALSLHRWRRRWRAATTALVLLQVLRQRRLLRHLSQRCLKQRCALSIVDQCTLTHCSIARPTLLALWSAPLTRCWLAAQRRFVIT